MKARDLVEKHFGARPSAHPVENLHVQARKMRALAAAAAKKCHDTECWDRLVKLAEIILNRKPTRRED